MRGTAATLATVLGLAAGLLAGCGGGDDEQVRTLTGETETGRAPDDRRGTGEGRPPPPDASDERVIRGWSAALNAERYGLAADHFARPSIVEQVQEVRLPDRRAAIAFNRSLPCKAEVTDVKAQGDSTVAAFDLAPGPGGSQACRGDARVRFVIGRGRIEEWRQLRGPQAPDGDVVRHGAGGPGVRHG